MTEFKRIADETGGWDDLFSETTSPEGKARIRAEFARLIALKERA